MANTMSALTLSGNDLESAGATENTARTGIRCREFRPCKRTTCWVCQERRRSYFVDAGTLLAGDKRLNLHVTVTWSLSPGDTPWGGLVSLSAMLSKRLTGRIGPFIRTLAIGKYDTPHVHYLINADFKNRFYVLAKNNCPEGSRIFIDSELTHDVSGLLDYFFNRNFTPTVNDPRRVKGIRLMSGSREKLTYSYPRTRHWKQLEEWKRSKVSVHEK